MGQTLTNGIYLPDEGERNSYSGLEANWRTLDALILTINGKATPNVANTWTAAQTFTAGIVGDLTGNVTGNVTGTAAKAIADEDGTSIKTGYVNVAGNQTVSGQKTWTGSNTFTSTITTKTNVDRAVAPTSDTTYGTIICRDKNGSAMFRMQGTIKTDLSNAWDMMMVAPNNSYITFFRYTISTATSDRELRFKADSVIPDDNSTSKLGTSTKQWSSVYAQTYFYNGVEFQSKFVTTDTEQTITSLKTLSTAGSPQLRVKSTSIDLTNTTITSYRTISIRAIDKNDTTLGQISWNYKASDNTGRLYLTQTSRDAVTGGIIIQHNGSNSTTDIIPYSTTDDHNLGTSTNKWKTLNGVNPGALSLPTSSYVEIDTTNWDLTGASSQSYTPAVSGWLFVSIQNIVGNYLSIVGGRGAVSMDGTGVQAGLRAMLPVVANESVTITVKTGSIFAARFYPMLGNV